MIPEQFVSVPLNHIAEVTLLGAGAYGESLICHTGNQEWIIIDSCVNPNENNRPLPLEYLRSIGVPFANIKLVVCTHWHDDHIKGLSRILEEAPNAEFCISRAHDKDKFLAFVGMDSGKAINYSTREFTNCLKILMKRKAIFTDALENLSILRNAFSTIICLSPSNYTTQRHDKIIASMLPYLAVNKRVPYFTPNATSIVIYAKFGYHRAILGGDLELSKNPEEGWLKVISNTISIDEKANLIKISHHGSENGYCEDIWKYLLTHEPVAKLTPWSLGGNSLPVTLMIEKYLSHTNELYITNHIVSAKQKSRDAKLEKLIKELKPGLKEEKYKLGIIRSRINMEDKLGKWEVENILSAKKLNS